MLGENVVLEGELSNSSNMAVLSAKTFFIAVSAGLEAVRPEIGAM